MIIEQADRVDVLVFTLPVRESLWQVPASGPVDPLSKAQFMGDLFDDYVDGLVPEQIRRTGYPEQLLSRKQWDQVGIVFREGWELWQARYARLTLTDGREAG